MCPRSHTSGLISGRVDALDVVVRERRDERERAGSGVAERGEQLVGGGGRRCGEWRGHLRHSGNLGSRAIRPWAFPYPYRAWRYARFAFRLTSLRHDDPPHRRAQRGGGRACGGRPARRRVRGGVRRARARGSRARRRDHARGAPTRCWPTRSPTGPGSTSGSATSAPSGPTIRRATTGWWPRPCSPEAGSPTSRCTGSGASSAPTRRPRTTSASSPSSRPGRGRCRYSTSRCSASAPTATPPRSSRTTPRSHAPETRACVAVHDAPKPPPDRVTLTLRALRAARSRLILATGPGKAEAVAAVLAGPDPGGPGQPPGRPGHRADRRRGGRRARSSCRELGAGWPVRGIDRSHPAGGRVGLGSRLGVAADAGRRPQWNEEETARASLSVPLTAARSSPCASPRWPRSPHGPRRSGERCCSLPTVETRNLYLGADLTHVDHRDPHARGQPDSVTGRSATRLDLRASSSRPTSRPARRRSPRRSTATIRSWSASRRSRGGADRTLTPSRQPDSTTRRVSTS